MLTVVVVLAVLSLGLGLNLVLLEMAILPKVLHLQLLHHHRQPNRTSLDPSKPKVQRETNGSGVSMMAMARTMTTITTITTITVATMEAKDVMLLLIKPTTTITINTLLFGFTKLHWRHGWSSSKTKIHDITPTDVMIVPTKAREKKWSRARRKQTISFVVYTRSSVFHVSIYIYIYNMAALLYHQIVLHK